MAEQITRGNKLILELLESSRAANEQEILETAQAMIDKEEALQEGTSVAALLKEEALALSQRMLELNQKPRIKHWLGRKAASQIVCEEHEPITDYKGLAKAYKASGMTELQTPLLFRTNPEFVGLQAIVQGWVFGIKLYPAYKSKGKIPDGRLAIYQVAEDIATGKREAAETYTILFADEEVATASALKSGIYSDEIENYKSGVRKARLLELREKHPDLMDKYDKYRSTEFKDKHLFWLVVSSVEKQKGNKVTIPEPYDITREEEHELHLISSQLEAEIEVPDSFYSFPLGLIIQARRELGDKNV